MAVTLTVEKRTRHPDGTVVAELATFAAPTVGEVADAFARWHRATGFSLDYVAPDATETVDALRERMKASTADLQTQARSVP